MSKNKNHFIYPYPGNKRNEMEHILEYSNFENKELIIESYCGSCSISYFISQKYPLKFKYHLNDNNIELIEILKILKNPEQTAIFEKNVNEQLETIVDKQAYLKVISKKTLEAYYIKNKVYSIRPGMYNLAYKYKYLSFDNYPIINFIRNEDVTFYTDDGIDFMNRYKNNENAIIYLDPPYINSCNAFYKTPKINIYEYLFENDILTFKAEVMLILENTWIIQLLFKNKIMYDYSKKYQITKKQTSHLIVSNNKKYCSL